MSFWQILTIATVAASIGIAGGGATLAVLMYSGYFWPNTANEMGFGPDTKWPPFIVFVASLIVAVVLVQFQQSINNHFLERERKNLQKIFKEIEMACGTENANRWLAEYIRSNNLESSLVNNIFLEPAERNLLKNIMSDK